MPASTAAAARRAARAKRPPAAGRRAPSGIRWDRLGSVALLGVLVGVLFLYVGPAHSWYDTWRTAKAKRAQVLDLRAQNQRLRERRRELLRPTALEREARRLGMVRKGERAYVIRGLPEGR